MQNFSSVQGVKSALDLHCCIAYSRFQTKCISYLDNLFSYFYKKTRFVGPQWEQLIETNCQASIKTIIFKEITSSSLKKKFEPVTYDMIVSI